VTIPKIQLVLDYIDRELDELEREDFTRLKLVQGKKEQALLARQKEADELAEEERAKGREATKANDTEDITANFDAGDDVDVVF